MELLRHCYSSRSPFPFSLVVLPRYQYHFQPRPTYRLAKRVQATSSSSSRRRQNISSLSHSPPFSFFCLCSIIIYMYRVPSKELYSFDGLPSKVSVTYSRCTSGSLDIDVVERDRWRLPARRPPVAKRAMSMLAVRYQHRICIRMHI